MSSQTVQQIKAHFLTSQQWGGKSNPAANELWFVKMPHWLKYSNGGCLGITTQPTTSGDEIDFYAGAAFVLHCGKNADGTNNNQIIYIDEDKYTSVDSDGAYCFDSNGDMVVGSSISYDSSTNTVTVDGTDGYHYTSPVQTFTYSGGIVSLGSDIKPMTFGGGGSAEYITDPYDTDTWCVKIGNVCIQGGSGYMDYGDYYTTVYFPEPMESTNYSAMIMSNSYYQPYAGNKYTTSMEVNVSEAYDIVNFQWLVIGECE